MSSFASTRLTILGGGALLIAMVPAVPATADSETPRPRVSAHPIFRMVDAVIVPGGTILVRTKDGVFATIHTSGLESGTAVTAWFAIFQNPQHCATSPCTGADLPNPEVGGSVLGIGGRVIGADGAATFGGFREVGDTTSSGGPPGTPNLGLLRPFKAEIHLVTRTHGLASSDPVVLQEQVSSFNGGCPPNSCRNLQASIHQP